MNIVSTLRRALTALALSVSLLAPAANSVVSSSIPDFAYPQTVATDARKQLNASLRAGDETKALRSLIDFALAETAVGSENTPNAIAEVKSTIEKLTDSNARAIANILLASIYSDLFNADSYKYNARELPLTPIPDNYTEWSGDQFRKVISDLCAAALVNKSALQNASLSDYSSLISVPTSSRVYFPSLYDFIAHRSISLLSSLSQYSRVLGIVALSPRSTFMIAPPSVISDSQVQQIMDIYADLLRFHTLNPAPEIYCDIQRIIFAKSHTYTNLSDDSERSAITLLKGLYYDYLSSEYSGDVLIAMANYTSSRNQSGELSVKEYYTMLKDFAHRYPTFARIDCINSQLAILTQPNVTVSSPGQVAPGYAFQASISVSNLNKVTLNLYRVNNKVQSGQNQVSTSVKASTLATLKPIDQVTIDFTDSIPFSSTRKVSFTVPEFGIYCIAPSRDVITSARNSFDCFRATRLYSGELTDSLDTRIFVIDPLTGRPVDQASILFAAGRAAPSEIGKTDTDGFLTLHPTTWSSARPVLGNDIFAPANYVDAPANYVNDWTSMTNAFTDLPLYHPGDSVKWCAIAYRFRNTERQLLDNTPLSAVMFNANSLQVDTLDVTTDIWGRINGAFHIPEGELTGPYRIVFRSKEKNNVLGMTYFTVSDYKLPTYYLTIDKPASGVPSDGDVTITGVAKTYSGVPMGGIPVKAVISSAIGNLWMRSNSIKFCTLSDTTSADGQFTLVLTKNQILNSPAPQGFFTAEISATSLSGESQQASAEFVVGNSYTIESKLPEALDTDHDIDLLKYFSLVDSRGNRINDQLNYSLVDRRNESDTIRGTLSNAMNLSKLPSSTYTLTVSASNYDADPVTATVILYRAKSQVSPVDRVIWSPVSDVKIPSGRKTKLNVFASENDVMALLSIFDNASILSSKWIKLKKGHNEVEVKIPDNMKSIRATLLSMLNYSGAKLDFTISTSEPEPSLSIIAESFRDRLIPGGNETWTFRTVDADSTGSQSAMIFGMYNDALNSLQQSSWNISFAQSIRNFTSATLNGYSSSVGNGFCDLKYKMSCDGITTPFLQTYGLSFTPLMRSRTTLLYKSASTNGAAMRVTEEVKMSADMGLAGMAPGVHVAESELAEEASVDTAADAAGSDAKSMSEPFQYRDSETPLAFFNPTLTTDPAGHVAFSFTVPNANTTWDFTALAYDKAFSTARFHRSVLANKPLMVQPNLPRFLRSGDVITIPATVMNNTDSTVTATVTVEFFNPANMDVISRHEPESVTIPANGSAVTSVTLTAPSQSPFIGYRVKASSDKFADGEQSLIPILEAAQPVIETSPFYISPDSASFSMKLPEYGPDARVTFQFCDNPTWYVVTALPGLSASEASTAPQAAAAIYSAAVADGLLRSVPRIADALRQWTLSDRSDSTLVSMLSRNSDLKTFLLQATPWMLDAQSDTERMQRLALLFDKDNIRNTYDTNINLLSKLSRSSGGWAWVNQYSEPSAWATYQTLLMLGRLNQLGFMPDNNRLSSMISRALSFYQSEIEKEWKKTPTADYTSFVMLLDMYPSFTPSSTSSKIISRTVQNAVASWKKYSLLRKTDAAVILQRHGYPRVARQIAESLRQYSKSTPTKGMYWPLLSDMSSGSMTELTLTARILQALHLINPTDPSIDAIRQWLILQKEARDWGSSSSASEVCAAILLTSPRWIERAGTPDITIDGATVPFTPTDETLGYMRADISELTPSGKTLHIEKSTLTPSWGAVYAQSTQQMTAIEAASVDGLSIEKQLYRLTDSGWEAATDLKVGDKVKIELLIHADRAVDYVAIDDNRAACLEPVDQLPTPLWSEGICFYRENRDSATNIFISTLPAGTYRLSYEMWVNSAGTFASGIATLQSQYAPALTAHSSGSLISVAPQ